MRLQNSRMQAKKRGRLRELCASSVRSVLNPAKKRANASHNSRGAAYSDWEKLEPSTEAWRSVSVNSAPLCVLCVKTSHQTGERKP